MTIERAPAPISVISSMNSNHDQSYQHLQGPRNVTMNVMDMPSSLSGTGNSHGIPGSNHQPTRKPLHLPQDVQLISVGHSHIQAPKPLRTTELTQTSSSSASASNMASPPNKSFSEAIKAENVQEQQNLKEDQNQDRDRACLVVTSGFRPTASTPSSVGSNSTTNSSSTATSSSGGGGKYVCNVCKKDFPTNALLNIHAKIHYFERPYRLEFMYLNFRLISQIN